MYSEYSEDIFNERESNTQLCESKPEVIIFGGIEQRIGTETSNLLEAMSSPEDRRG